jgi:hypothetical protein
MLGTYGSVYSIRAPRSRSFSMMSSDGLSRTSSMSALYATPSTSRREPRTDLP